MQLRTKKLQIQKKRFKLKHEGRYDFKNQFT